MASKKAVTPQKATGAALAKEQVFEIPISKIKADLEWNARHGLITEDSGDESKNNFTDLVNSIEAKGQDTPVIVRPVGNGGNFSLVAGFRRYLAIQAIGKKQTNPNITIKAYIRNYSELEAQAENIRENTARDDLRGPDLAWAIDRLAKTYKAKGLNPTSVMLAAEIGKNQGYVNKLMRIMEKTEQSKVSKLWRDAPFQVSISDMEKIATYESDRQVAAFEEITKNRSGSGGQGAGGGRGKWLEAALTKAESVGALLGKLAKAEVIDCDGLDFGEADHVRLCVKFKEDATAGQVTKVGNALQKGYDASLKAKAETDETPPPSAAKRANGRRAEA